MKKIILISFLLFSYNLQAELDEFNDETYVITQPIVKKPIVKKVVIKEEPIKQVVKEVVQEPIKEEFKVEEKAPEVVEEPKVEEKVEVVVDPVVVEPIVKKEEIKVDKPTLINGKLYQPQRDEAKEKEEELRIKKARRKIFEKYKLIDLNSL